MRLHEINLREDDAVNKVMKDFDTSENNEIDFQEFIAGITSWIEEAKASRIKAPMADPDTLKYIHEYYEVTGWVWDTCKHSFIILFRKVINKRMCIYQETKKEHDLLGDDAGEDDEEEGVDDPRGTTIKAILFLLIGTFIAAAFADPLVDAVGGFSTATSIPSFFISFIALPLATNSSEAVSAIIFATRKKKRSASLTFSEVCVCLTFIIRLDQCGEMGWSD